MRIKKATGDPMAGEIVTATGHMRACGRLFEIDPRCQNSMRKHEAITCMIAKALADTLPYADRL